MIISFYQNLKKDEVVNIPVAHHDGNYFIDNDGLKDLEANGQILLKYCDKNGKDKNLNGSVSQIAGICNKEKNVFGLMPHPERAMEELLGCDDGVIMLKGFFKIVKKILAIFLFIVSFLNAEEFVSTESSAFGTPIQKQVAKPTRTYGSKNLYLSYINYPKHIYKNQRFEVEIKALITRENYDYIQTRFLNGINMTPLNPKESWKKIFR